MSKWCEVPVVIQKTYAVQLDDDQTIDDAIEAVIMDCSGAPTINPSDCWIGETESDNHNIKVCADDRLLA